jgi:adenylate cyclase
LNAVVPTESQAEAVRKQLDRVLASPGFGRNERLSRFLRFVVDRHLEGRDQELKESLIAVEVFGRKPDYDPKQDSIVRSEAARLRARLVEYYAGGGKDDALVIELPKGGYTPVFRSPALTVENATPAPAIRPGFAAAVACFALALAAAGWWWTQRQAAPVAIAVLPLDNLSHDPANDYFADGLTDELIRNLSLIEGLAPRSQTSSFAFKGKPRNVREVAKQMEADYILEGSVLRLGNQLRINAQLIRARDDFPLWVGRYDRELTDVLAIQDEISRGIVNSLRLKLGRGRRRYETSTEAYDLYLRARALQLQRGLKAIDQTIDTFEQAIAKDPSFAPAYAGLAAAHASRSGSDRDGRDIDVSKMREAVEKALQLDPMLAEAHDARGMVYARDAQWEEAEKSFRRALELDPNRSLSRTDVALNLLLPLGRIEEAVAQARLAEKSDPLSPQVEGDFAYTLLSAGRFEEAAAHCSSRGDCLGRALLGQGKIDQAVRALEAGLKDGTTTAGELGYAYARQGRREEAEKFSEAARSPIGQARIFTALGDKDRAFEALNRALSSGPVRIGRNLTWWEFAPLRGDPRLKALRKKIGLPE